MSSGIRDRQRGSGGDVKAIGDQYLDLDDCANNTSLTVRQRDGVGRNVWL